MDFLQEKHVLKALRVGLAKLVERIRDEIIYHSAEVGECGSCAEVVNAENEETMSRDSKDSGQDEAALGGDHDNNSGSEMGDEASVGPTRRMTYDSIINAPEKGYSFAASSFDPLAFLANELRLIKQVEVQPEAQEA